MTETADRLVVEPGGRCAGAIVVPGDKSISHRSVMFGAVAHGKTTIDGCLMGEDVLSTIGAFRAMGVPIEIDDGVVTIEGRGFEALTTPRREIDLGNSGTSIRLLTGLLAGAGISVSMGGDASLSKRPMRRVADPIAAMGASIETSDDGTPPVTLRSGDSLRAIRYTLPVASAQVKSAILLAGLNAEGRTCVVEPTPTRDHTERLLPLFGVDVHVDGSLICIDGGQPLSASHVDVPGDISSAAFFIVGAAIADDSELTIRNVGLNPTRTGVIEILRRMGATIETRNERRLGAEPVADLFISSSQLRGIEIPRDLIPSAIDEFPILFIAAACAQGTTVLRGAEELRHKESDRLDSMAVGLQALGVPVAVSNDGIEITGIPGAITGGRIASHGDHRIAMAFAIAALVANGPVEIAGAAAIATSFPDFARLARELGIGISIS